jgi:hypothetical protein
MVRRKRDELAMNAALWAKAPRQGKKWLSPILVLMELMAMRAPFTLYLHSFSSLYNRFLLP